MCRNGREQMKITGKKEVFVAGGGFAAAEELAARFDLGLTAMKQCFKSIYGKPIYQYLKEYRMNQAAEILLTEREKTITEIAVQCGYDNPGKFGQVFRSQFGMAPLEYRKSNGRRDIR